MANDRRDFFKTVGAATAAVVLAKPAAAEAAVAANRYVPAYRHAVVLSGVAEEILSVDAGNYRGIVVTQNPGNGVLEKHIANIAAEDCTIALGASQSDELYAWIRQMTLRSPLKKNPFLISGDSTGTPRGQMEYYDAIISELTFPALDAKNRDAAQILLSFMPGRLRINRPPTLTTRFGTKQKVWQCAHFRLKINGLEDSCAAVTAIEALTFTQDVTKDQFGEINGYLPLQVPNLAVYCPEEFAGQFVDWHYDFLVNGNRTSAYERTGTLEFLAPDKKTVYFTLTLSGLGIYGCGLEGEEMKTGAKRSRKVEIYCETMTFAKGGLA